MEATGEQLLDARCRMTVYGFTGVGYGCQGDVALIHESGPLCALHAKKRGIHVPPDAAKKRKEATKERGRRAEEARRLYEEVEAVTAAYRNASADVRADVRRILAVRP